ncbi:TPA: hypothetical protein ACGAD2_005510 [Salmonella enterica subsp. enterica serovar Newport]
MKKLHLLFVIPAVLFGQSALASQQPQYQDMLMRRAINKHDPRDK